MKIDISELQDQQSAKQSLPIDSILTKDIGLSFSQKHSNVFLQKFYQSLHGLLDSGLDIITALTIIENQQKKKHAQSVRIISNEIAKGAFLSKAIENTKVFHAYDSHLIAIGERTGRLIEILKELEGYYANKIKIRRMLISALSYPMLVIGVSVGVLYFMLGFLIPTFNDIYQRMSVELPAITQMMLNVSEQFTTYSYLLPLSVLIVITLYLITKRNLALKAKLQAIVLKLPFVGSMLIQVQLMRFSHSMYLLLSSKIPITEALKLSSELSNVIPFKNEVDRFCDGIIAGASFSSLINNSSLFDPQYVAMIQVGEQTGTLSNVFEKLFEQKMTKMNHLTKVIGDVIEPILIVVIGGLVALVLIAMYLPMFSLSGGF